MVRLHTALTLMLVGFTLSMFFPHRNAYDMKSAYPFLSNSENSEPYVTLPKYSFFLLELKKLYLKPFQNRSLLFLFRFVSPHPTIISSDVIKYH